MANSKVNRKLSMLFILLSIAWICLLFIESSQPPAEIMSEVHGLDKLAHFIAFGILTVFICGAWFYWSERASLPLFSPPLLLATLAGVFEEGYQITVPERAGELADLVADVGGAMFVIMMLNRIILVVRNSRRISAE